MKNPVATLTLAEWVADQVKAIAPYSKTVMPTDWYFAAGYDDVNVEFSRKIDGYSNHHFTTKSLCEFYGAVSCTFNTEYGIALEFDSWDKVIQDENGKIYPKKRN